MKINNRDEILEKMTNGIMEAMEECGPYGTDWFIEMCDGIATVRVKDIDSMYGYGRDDVYLVYKLKGTNEDAVDFFGMNFTELAEVCGLTEEELHNRTVEWLGVGSGDGLDFGCGYDYDSRDYIRENPDLLDKVEDAYHEYLINSDIDTTIRNEISAELDRIEAGYYDVQDC